MLHARPGFQRRVGNLDPLLLVLVEDSRSTVLQFSTSPETLSKDEALPILRCEYCKVYVLVCCLTKLSGNIVNLTLAGSVSKVFLLIFLPSPL